MAVRGIWADGVTADGATLRLLTVATWLAGDSPLTVRGGLRWTPGDPGLVTAAAGMAVRVNPFIGVVPGTSSALQGAYPLALDTQATIALTPANAQYGRKDLIVATVNDVGSAASQFAVVPVTGAPAPTPQSPDLPPNSVALAEVTVPANATAPSAIRDLRTWLTAPDAPRLATTVDYVGVQDISFNQVAWTVLSGPSGTFVAPTSGRVLVTVAARLRVASNGWVAVSARLTGPTGYLRDPATLDELRSHILSASADTGQQSDITFPVGGLTPGATYTALMVGRVNTAATTGWASNRRILVAPASA